MLRKPHSYLMAAFLFGMLFTFSETASLSARCPTYRGERAAWGGNGGWWGGGNEVFYDDAPWRTQDIPCSPHRVCKPRHYPCSYSESRRPCQGRYRYQDSRYSSCRAENEETVPGAGLYLDLEPERCR